jgi:hypothetical protein
LSIAKKLSRIVKKADLVVSPVVSKDVTAL